VRSKKPSVCYHIDATAEELLQINLELAVIEKRPSRLEVDQEVHVAVRTGLAARHGPKHANVPGTMTLSDRQNGAAAGPQEVCNLHG